MAHLARYARPSVAVFTSSISRRTTTPSSMSRCYCNCWLDLSKRTLTSSSSSSDSKKIVKSNLDSKKVDKPSGTTTTTDSSSANNESNIKKKKKKKKRSNIQQPLVPTKKDKLRQPSSQKDLNNEPFLSTAIQKQIADFPQSMEEKIVSFRNYTKSLFLPKHYIENNGENNQRVKKRVGPKMDTKWWVYNILFSLLPAFVIATYCEFIGKPEMELYFQEMKEREKRRIMGDDYVSAVDIHEEELADGAGMIGGGGGVSILDVMKPKEKSESDSFLNRVAGAIQDLFFGGMEVDDKEDLSSSSPSSSTDSSSSSSSFSGSDNAQGTNDDKEASYLTMQKTDRMPIRPTVVPGDEKEGEKEEKTPSFPNDSGNTRTDESEKIPQHATDEAMLQTLLLRIEELERKIGIAEEEAARQRRIREHRIRYQLERQKQSPIQNRGENQMIEQWRQEDALKMKERRRRRQEGVAAPNDNDNGKDDETSHSNTTWDMISTLLSKSRENINAKREMMEKYGMDIMDRAWGYGDDKNDRNDDGGEKKKSLSESKDSVGNEEKDDDAGKTVEATKNVTEAAISSSGQEARSKNTGATVTPAVEEASRSAARAAALASKSSSATAASVASDQSLKEAVGAAEEAAAAAEEASRAAAKAVSAAVASYSSEDESSVVSRDSSSPPSTGIVGRTKAWVSNMVRRGRGNDRENE